MKKGGWGTGTLHGGSRTGNRRPGRGTAAGTGGPPRMSQVPQPLALLPFPSHKRSPLPLSYPSHGESHTPTALAPPCRVPISPAPPPPWRVFRFPALFLTHRSLPGVHSGLWSSGLLPLGLVLRSLSLKHLPHHPPLCNPYLCSQGPSQIGFQMSDHSMIFK